MPRKPTAEKIADIQARIEELRNEEKKLLNDQKELDKKARTHRLCSRMGLFESLLPDTIPLTDEQFTNFLKRTVLSSYGRKILVEIKEQDGGIAAELRGKAPSPNGDTAVPLSANAEQGGGDVAEPTPSALAEGGGSAMSAKADDKGNGEA